MCGFCGFARAERRNREGDEALVRTMNARIAHRGPDDDGFFVGNGLAMGHRRLSIIDLNTGHQPILDEKGEHGIVFNGEIYNYRELRAELEAKGHKFRTHSDTEVILRLYLEEGKACVERLNGIFAFAIFHVPSGDVFLARDHFGVKPLYWGQSQSGDLFFGSELKALLPFLAPRKPTLDRAALELFLVFEHVPAPYSIYREIRKLEAGHRLIYRGGKAHVERYFEPRFTPKRDELSFDEAAERLDVLLKQAVKRQMVSDVPVGSFLSGGVDSSLIATLLSREAGKPIDTFSIGFEQKSFDESSYAELVAKRIGSRHRSEVFSLDRMRAELPKVLAGMDEPFADPSILPTSLLSRFARQTVKVAMSGDGSDEIFAGYPTYQARRVGDWVPAPLGRVGALAASALPTSMENISFDFKVKRFFRGFETGDADLRHQIWLGAYSLGELARVLPGAARDMSILSDHMERADGVRGWERSLWCDFRFFLQDNMFTKVDRASMMHGLEVRVPFLDRDLVDFALRLPADFKLKGNETKALLKRVALKYIPEEIVKRPKKGFGIPVADWIRGELNPLVRERLAESRLREEGLFAPAAVSNMLARHESGKVDYRKQLWALFVFESWRENGH